MKKFISALMIFGFATSSFANCINAFENAAFKREQRNQALVVVGAVAAVVTVAVLADNSSSGSTTTVRVETDSERRERLRRQNFRYYHRDHYRSHHINNRYYVRNGYYTHPNYGHRYYHRHYRRSYGYYYVDSSPADERWLGDNNFDRVLKAYNDSVVAFNNDVVETTSKYLNRINKLVAKKVVKLARRAGELDKVRDIKADKNLTKIEDKKVVRDALMAGIENTGANGFCPGNDALKRTQVVESLAKTLLESR